MVHPVFSCDFFFRFSHGYHLKMDAFSVLLFLHLTQYNYTQTTQSATYN